MLIKIGHDRHKLMILIDNDKFALLFLSESIVDIDIKRGYADKWLKAFSELNGAHAIQFKDIQTIDTVIFALNKLKDKILDEEISNSYDICDKLKEIINGK